ncbi:hypothetical protein Q4543_09070 [Salipiger sp. 1_MG-2023]|uniref:hypothetical protein n=1 Tax=Salipiger sp. 1_MG-2023 TaxID=3062665 RepID=UPI0026E26170|nr:hypothetical protein [Salipiger sp. 1_MG-2023]MDO6585670.1 hypothetical protein [Salipiger sp. 1_MG-2023]
MTGIVSTLALLLTLCAGAALAQAQITATVHVIGNDDGGPLRQRLAEVQRLNARGARVEIRGAHCHSACTLYLGVRNLCILPQTEFGFHGPVYPDRPMARERFDHWSRAMAAHYPPPVAGWFMTTARHVASGYVALRGEALIGLGIPRCR